MEKMQKKRVKRYLSWGVLALVVVMLAIMPMLAADNAPADGPQASILQEQAQLRNISGQIVGGGALTAIQTTDVTMPAQVKVTEYLVSNGDVVSEGQAIAAVDRVSVMSAISQIQETLELIHEDLEDVSGETAQDTVTATAGGTVKAVYGEEGQNVRDVILENGALAVISLDGKMAVKLTTNTGLAGGDEVNVTLSDGTQIQGKVESNLEGILAVTVEDDDYAMGQTVTVSDLQGEVLGEGALYVHSQWNALAYSGTISKVRVSQGDQVRSGKTLFDLKDTGNTAAFDSLTRQHRQYEEMMLELFEMYQSGYVTAPADGMVTGVDENGVYMLSAAGNWSVSLLSNNPLEQDDAGYINYVGQVNQVGVDGLVVKINPQVISVTDYQDLSALPMDTSLMTQDVIYNGAAPVYELVGGAWTQIGMEQIASGDILLFTGDVSGNFVWVIRLAKGQLPPQEPETPEEPTQPEEEPTQPEEEPSQPAEPSQPEEPDTPTDPDASQTPGDTTQPGMPQTGIGQGIGSLPSMGMGMGYGGMTQEEEKELYPMDTVSIASVIDQTSLLVNISVDELDISRVYVGQTAQLDVTALPGEQFAATVRSISASGENQGGNSKFAVEVVVDKAPDMLAGMSAVVTLNTDITENAVTVPVAALVEQGDKTLVYTGYDQEEEQLTDPVEVTVGVSDGTYVQILSGISQGQTVYYAFYDTLEISYTPEFEGFSFGI